MKKYLGLFIVFLMVFVLGNKIAQAKDSSDNFLSGEVNGSVKIETSDDDKDGEENKKNDSSVTRDNDDDGIIDSKDQDDDGDGILDLKDLKPLDNDNDGQNDESSES